MIANDVSDAELSYPSGSAPAMSVQFVGGRGALFWLAFKTGFLTIITLGFYRFWMKTRLRRWYWSAIRPGGHPMEYVGDPIEKLLGFFIAVVILTFYIGIINLILMFVSFSVFSSATLGYFAAGFGVVPLWFYARYRARRYVLGRTRWRGVRFGLDKGAWGYVWRALLHWLVTIFSLGLLWPRMTFYLEKYMTDRTFFGSAQLHQGGRWGMLYRAAIPFALFTLLLLGSVAYAYISAASQTFDTSGFASKMLETLADGQGAPFSMQGAWWLLLFPVSLLGMVYGAVHYRFVSKRLMANHKSTNGIAITSRLSAPRIAFIYVFGSFIAYSVLVLGVILLVLGAFVVIGPSAFMGFDLGIDIETLPIPRALAIVVLAGFYLSVFLMWNVCYNTFVTFPLMRHMAKTCALPRYDGLQSISQSGRDDFAEAEGFAEALDLGAAI